jgi:hypothetical protein
MSVFSNINMPTPACFWTPLAWNISPSFHFQFVHIFAGKVGFLQAANG